MFVSFGLRVVPSSREKDVETAEEGRSVAEGSCCFTAVLLGCCYPVRNGQLGKRRQEWGVFEWGNGRAAAPL